MNNNWTLSGAEVPSGVEVWTLSGDEVPSGVEVLSEVEIWILSGDEVSKCKIVRFVSAQRTIIGH